MGVCRCDLGRIGVGFSESKGGVWPVLLGAIVMQGPHGGCLVRVLLLTAR